MSILPEDFSWLTFISGAALGAVAMFFSGFVGEAGKDLYIRLKGRNLPPEPLKISTKYIPSVFPPDQCVWVREESTPIHEERDSFYYPHPDNPEGKCYREVSSGGQICKEYLMVKKGAS